LAIVVPRRSWLEISLWKTGKGRKKEKEHIRKKEKEHTRKKRDGIQTAELNRRELNPAYASNQGMGTSV